MPKSADQYIVMHCSRLPFRYRFIAGHLLTGTKKSFSASELQCWLGHKYYESVWAMVHKLRVVTGKRNEEYTLSGVLELDGEFFTADLDDEEKNKSLKRVRGSQRKSKALVMVESEPSADDDDKVSSRKPSRAGKKFRRVGHIKMIVMEDLKSGDHHIARRSECW